MVRSQKPNTDLCVIFPPEPPGVLLHMNSDEDNIHMFLHYNYTMFRCYWGCPATAEEKVSIFQDMYTWLKSFNCTLNANFYENDDWLTWNIAQYNK